MIETKTAELVTPVLHELGFTLVRAKYFSEKGQKILQIMVEMNDFTQVNLEQCQQISRKISTLLDVENIISDRYRLEVSSPGINRPLTKKEDYPRFIDKKVHIKFKNKVGDRNKITGILKSAASEEVEVITEDNKELLKISYSNISNANLEII